MKSSILLDLDDTIADFRSVMYSSLKSKYKKVKPVHNWDSYNLTHHCNETMHKNILDLIINDNVLQNIKPHKFAKNTLDRLKQHYNIVIVTSRHYHPTAYDITKQWFNTHNIHYDNLHITGGDVKKSDVAKMYNVKYGVDDHIENYKDYENHGIKCILMDMPWNRNFEASQRIKCISELPE